MSDIWRTPHRSTPVDAVVALPGSKSLTARALVLAALADGPSRLVRPLRARDTELMAAGLRAIGVSIDDDGSPTQPDWRVFPAGLRGPAEIDAGLAGTVLRFLPPVAALATGPVRIDGDPRLRERPNAGLLAALRALDVEIDDGGRAEQLLGVGPHLGRHVGEQRRLHEGAGMVRPGAAGQHGGALVDGVPDLRMQVLRGALRGKRGERGGRVGRVAGHEGRERL